jgi:hypothetical protein
MRVHRLVGIGVGALALYGCTAGTAPRRVGVGGGGGVRVLVFIVQPTTAHISTPITPAVQVAVEDTLGVIDTTVAGAVTISLGTSQIGATLSGTSTVPFTAGVSTFTELNVNLAGSGYTLKAVSAGFSNVTSTSFSVIP